MAWVRIHDGAMHHPKLLQLSATAFRAWVHGLCYCQMHLTDGMIPAQALAVLGARAADAKELVTRGLWASEDSGFRVHDYLDWNDSRDEIVEKRDRARHRAYVSRTNSARANARAAHVVVGECKSTDLTKIQDPERESERKPSGLVPGRRIFLHRWQLDALIATLGPHAPDFGLDDWIEAVNERAAQGALPRDPWKWVQSELHAEIARRGLAVVEEAPAAPTNKRIAGLQKGGEAFLRMAAERKAREIGQ